MILVMYSKIEITIKLVITIIVGKRGPSPVLKYSDRIGRNRSIRMALKRTAANPDDPALANEMEAAVYTLATMR